MADVITTIHPEGAPEDNLYPNIKKENLPIALQPVADFALSEYEKGLNLAQNQHGNGNINCYGYISSGNPSNSGGTIQWYDVSLDANKPYTFSVNAKQGNSSDVWFLVAFQFEDNTYDQGAMEGSGLSSSYQRFTKTYTPSKRIVRFFFGVNSYGNYIVIQGNSVMLNEGSVALPYQPYNGPVMHAIDVDGVKLWENGNPTSAFASRTVTISDSTGYKRLKFVFKRTNDNYIVPNILETNNGFGDVYLNAVLRGVVYSREVHILDYTSIQFADGYGGTTSNNTACIPVAIYGIK